MLCWASTPTYRNWPSVNSRADVCSRAGVWLRRPNVSVTLAPFCHVGSSSVRTIAGATAVCGTVTEPMNTLGKLVIVPLAGGGAVGSTAPGSAAGDAGAFGSGAPGRGVGGAVGAAAG